MATCSFQGSPVAREVDFTSSCDIAKRALAQSVCQLRDRPRSGRHRAPTVKVGETVIKELAVPTATKADRAQVRRSQQ